MSINSVSYNPQICIPVASATNRQQVVGKSIQMNHSNMLMQAALQANSQNIVGAGVFSGRAANRPANQSLLQRIYHASSFGKAAAINTRAHGALALDGIQTFTAQKNIAEYLGVFEEIVSLLDSKIGGANPNAHGLQQVADTPSLGEDLGLLGQDLLLEQLTGEARQQIVSCLNIAPDDATSLGIVDSILHAVTGRAVGTSQQGTGNLSPEAASVLGIAGAAFSAYELVNNCGEMTLAGGVTSGASFGSYIGTLILPGAGTAVGGLIGAIGGGVLSLFERSGKGADQQARDKLRSFLQEVGFVNQNYQVRLADGSFYDIGKDGGHSYPNIDGSQRAAYDVDFSNPLSHQAIGWIQPLATILTGGNEKLKNDLTAYLVNAAQSNTDTLEGVAQNTWAFMNALGISVEQALSSIQSFAQQGLISQGQATAYIGGLVSLAQEIR